MTMEGYGVSKKDKPHYFDPQKWKQQKLEAMTDAAVRQKNAAFVAAHRSDTDEQLIAYVRQSAQEPGTHALPERDLRGRYDLRALRHMVKGAECRWAALSDAQGQRGEGCRISSSDDERTGSAFFVKLRAEKMETVQGR